jgi:hypothetical protein
MLGPEFRDVLSYEVARLVRLGLDHLHGHPVSPDALVGIKSRLHYRPE